MIVIRNKKFAIVLALFVFSLIIYSVDSVHAGPVLRRGFQGAAAGALVGGIVAGGDGAARGAAIGGTVGAISGAIERHDRRRHYPGPPPRPPRPRR